MGLGVWGCRPWTGAGPGQEPDVQEQEQGAGTVCCVRRGGESTKGKQESLYNVSHRETYTILLSQPHIQITDTYLKIQIEGSSTLCLDIYVWSMCMVFTMIAVWAAGPREGNTFHARFWRVVGSVWRPLVGGHLLPPLGGQSLPLVPIQRANQPKTVLEHQIAPPP